MSLAVVLTLVYPRQSLERRLAHSYKSKTPDQLAIGYLEAFLLADPNSTPLRLNLARQLTRMGSYSNAKNILAPLRQSDNPAWVDEAAWVDLEILVQEAFSIKDNPLLQHEKLNRVREQLEHLLTLPQTPERLLMIGQKGLSVAAPSVAKHAYEILVIRAPELDSEQYADAARGALGLQEYVVASNLYFLAMEYSKLKTDRRKYFFQAIETLQAGNMYDAVIIAADKHIGLLADDRETLIFLIKAAKASNHPEAARKYALRMLHISRLERWRDFGQFELAGYSYVDKKGDAVAVHSIHRVAGEIMLVQTPAAPAPAANEQKPNRLINLPYDEQTYKTAFDTFLANQDLDNARLVADAAVRQRPNDPVWRRRLAEVSEWSNQPRVALPHWLEYARLTGDEFGWDAVLRLAEGLNEADIVKIALQRKLERTPNDTKLLLKLAQLQANSGDTAGAFNLLRANLLRSKGTTSDRKARKEMLDMLAAIAEKSGKTDDLIAALQQLQREYGPSSSTALRIASLQYQRGRMEEAFAAMEQASGIVPEADATFWRNYAQLAQLTHRDAAMIRGYQHLFGAEAWQEPDLFALEGLLQKDYPSAAAQVTRFGYAKTGNVQFARDTLTLMIRAGDWTGAQAFLSTLPADIKTSNVQFARDTITLMIRAGDWAGAQAFISALPADMLAKMEEEPSFLSLRASIAQATGRKKDARSYIEKTLQLRPNDMEARASLMWTLIADRDTDALKRALTLWASDAENAPPLWGPFAAANMNLNRPHAALHWYRKRDFVEDDYLWFMSYAEALEAASQPDLAWRIRRKVWLDLRQPKVLTDTSPEELQQIRNRFAGLAPLFMTGDQALQVVKALLRSDVGKLAQMPVPTQAPRSGKELVENVSRLIQKKPATETKSAAAADVSVASLFAPRGGTRPEDDVRLSAGAREVALAYAMSREAHEMARAWLATQFAGQMAKPLWAELSLMLVANDKQGLNRLLDEAPDWLPILDRIEAAQRTGQAGLAESLAFEHLEQVPSSDPLHTRLTNLATLHPPTVEFHTRRFHQSPLVGNRFDLRVSTRLTEDTDVIAQIIEQKLSTNNRSQLPYVPGYDREFWLIARRRIETGYISGGVMHRDADDTNQGARVDVQVAPTDKATITATAGIHMPALESALLRAGGERSGAQATANYQFTRTEYGRLTLGWQQFSSQAGTTLGHAKNWITEVGTNLRTDYPNITIRAYASGISTSTNRKFDQQIARFVPAGNDPKNFKFVPDGDTVYGASIGLGNGIDGIYTRAIRPFLEAGITSSRVAGTGFNGMVGVAGSVFGNDVLRVRLQRISGTAANPSGFQEIGVDYKWYY